MALPKQYRLTRSKEFSKVYRFGKQASGNCLAVKVLSIPRSQTHPSYPRFGISISQKVSKRAVIRNRIKRQVRAALQGLLPRIDPGIWVVIVIRSEAMQCDYWQFLRELEQLFLELEVCNGH